MNKELFQTYADIKNKIKALEDEADKIKIEVEAEMNNDGVDKVESDFGTFYFTTRKSWKYSENVDIANNAVKALKKEEEEKGIATFEETKSLTYKA